MNEASISCVVPTRNSAATLATTLLSLRSQQNIALQVLVMDSDSTDGTQEICRQWNVPVQNIEAGNMYRAINAGLRECTTKWLTYLNSDDWLYTDSYARLMDYGEKLTADIVYGNCDYTDWQGRFVFSFAAAYPEQLLPLFRLGRMAFAQPAAIFRRELYEQLGGFDEGFRYKADADFFIRAIRAGARLAWLNGPAVACFRLHEHQFSNRADRRLNDEAARIFEAPEMKAGLRDHLTLWQWQSRNLPHYLIRIVRASLLSRRLRFPRTIETYTHD
jgi:glycosyltransferase involved in cell wall biosynthesis